MVTVFTEIRTKNVGDKTKRRNTSKVHRSVTRITYRCLMSVFGGAVLLVTLFNCTL